MGHNTNDQHQQHGQDEWVCAGGGGGGLGWVKGNGWYANRPASTIGTG